MGVLMDAFTIKDLQTVLTVVGVVNAASISALISTVKSEIGLKRKILRDNNPPFQNEMEKSLKIAIKRCPDCGTPMRMPCGAKRGSESESVLGCVKCGYSEYINDFDVLFAELNS